MELLCLENEAKRFVGYSMARSFHVGLWFGVQGVDHNIVYAGVLEFEAKALNTTLSERGCRGYAIGRNTLHKTLNPWHWRIVGVFGCTYYRMRCRASDRFGSFSLPGSLTSRPPRDDRLRTPAQAAAASAIHLLRQGNIPHGLCCYRWLKTYRCCSQCIRRLPCPHLPLISSESLDMPWEVPTL